MRRTLLTILTLSCTVIFISSMAENQPDILTVLKQDSGINLSEMNITFALSPTYGSAQVVEFTAPKKEWVLKGIQVVATNGWNSSNAQSPNPSPFAIEIRDSNLRLIYHFSDNQIPYFTSNEGAKMSSIELPDIPLSGDFYVCFYGYRSLALAAELQNTTGNSYYFDKLTGEIYLGTLPILGNQTHPVNWLIRVVGQ